MAKASGSTRTKTSGSTRTIKSSQPNKVSIMQKTFRVVNGEISVSVFDRQKRITAVEKFAKENGYKVKYTS